MTKTALQPGCQLRADGSEWNQVGPSPPLGGRDSSLFDRNTTDVLKMGFPFTNLEVTFDASDGGFKLNTGTPSMLSMEGLTGRQFIVDVSPIPPPYPVHLLETSTPSFPGHSGGPILDTTGTVWGINTRTQPRNSGSSTRLMDGSGVQISIPQQYNFGIGADAETIRGLLDHHSIEYQTD